MADLPWCVFAKNFLAETSCWVCLIFNIHSRNISSQIRESMGIISSPHFFGGDDDIFLTKIRNHKGIPMNIRGME